MKNFHLRFNNEVDKVAIPNYVKNIIDLKQFLIKKYEINRFDIELSQNGNEIM